MLNNVDGNQVLNMNRKRKNSDSENIVNQSKPARLINNGKSCTLNEAIKSKGTAKTNVLNNQFHKFDSKDKQIESAAEDNDCIITEEPETVIDLSDDDADESNKMIELIMCDETEPEPTDPTAKEYFVEIANECDDPDEVEPLDINFVSLNDQTNDSVDLIDMEDDETQQSSNSASATEKRCEKAIDLTNEPTVDEEETNVDIEGFRLSVIREIRRRLDKRFPGVVQRVSWNETSQQFEVSLSKETRFKVDDNFQSFLREVVNQAIQCNNDRVSKARAAARCSRKRVYAQANKNLILNKEYAGKPRQIASKHSESNRIASLSVANTSVVASGIQITTKYNVKQILRKSESYLGLRAETFRQIENLLSDRLRNRYMLVLILRKIKLNESFAILSDGLCLGNEDDGVNIFNKSLPLLSHSLKGLIQWPTNRREPLAIVDILHIEIDKPESTIKQNLTYCSHRQRYITSFIICITSTGYITHISTPLQAIRASSFMTCLRTIPHCSAVLANPMLVESVSLSKRSRISSLYDFDHQAERKVFQRVCDHLRRFRLISGISHLKNEMLLHHALSVAACLCNLELQQ